MCGAVLGHCSTDVIVLVNLFITKAVGVSVGMNSKDFHMEKLGNCAAEVDKTDRPGCTLLGSDHQKRSTTRSPTRN